MAESWDGFSFIVQTVIMSAAIGRFGRWVIHNFYGEDGRVETSLARGLFTVKL
jgi:hypothetical protein